MSTMRYFGQVHVLLCHHVAEFLFNRAKTVVYKRVVQVDGRAPVAVCSGKLRIDGGTV